MVEPHRSNFRVITTNILGVRIFRKFTVYQGVSYDIINVSLRFSQCNSYFTKCIGYNTNCINAVTKSNQMDTNTVCIVTNTL